MPGAEALVAWLEVLELPEMANYILLSSVLKQVPPIVQPLSPAPAPGPAVASAPCGAVWAAVLKQVPPRIPSPTGLIRCSPNPVARLNPLLSILNAQRANIRVLCRYQT